MIDTKVILVGLSFLLLGFGAVTGNIWGIIFGIICLSIAAPQFFK